MLLAVDVGNTNTVLGVYQGNQLAAHWRIETRKGRTEDEYAACLYSFFTLSGLPWKGTVNGAIVASVVPTALRPLESLCMGYLGVTPLVVGPGIRTGMPILADNAREVGADRIVNSVAAYERFRSGCIVVDFGTATTFDVVTPKGEYMGGAIAPGIGISADALYQRAAKLPRVEITRPKTVVGRNTITSMQSGLFFGYVGLVDGIVERMLAEIGHPARVIATGGLAPLVARDSRTIETSDEMLTLEGLNILFHRNQTAERPA